MCEKKTVAVFLTCYCVQTTRARARDIDMDLCRLYTSCFLGGPNRNVPWLDYLYSTVSELGHSSLVSGGSLLFEIGLGFVMPSTLTEIHKAEIKPDPEHEYSRRSFRGTVFYCIANPARY